MLVAVLVVVVVLAAVVGIVVIVALGHTIKGTGIGVALQVLARHGRSDSRSCRGHRIVVRVVTVLGMLVFIKQVLVHHQVLLVVLGVVVEVII